MEYNFSLLRGQNYGNCPWCQVLTNAPREDLLRVEFLRIVDLKLYTLDSGSHKAFGIKIFKVIKIP